MIALRLFLLVLLTATLLADGRKPWQGSVTLQGRRIDSFLLNEPLAVVGSDPMMVRAMRFHLIPGQYRPVAEDAEGYYFESNHGLEYTSRFQKGRGVGGVWVSKTKAGVMAPYRGRASDPKDEVDVMHFRSFTTAQMRKFAIANYEKPPGGRKPEKKR